MRKKRLILTVLFTLVLGLLVFIIPRKISIATINCKSQFSQCSGSIQNDLAAFSGESLITTKRRLKTYLADNVRIDSYNYHFVPPNSYDVTLVEKTASFSIQNTDYNSITLISNDGEVLAIVEESALPTLTINGKVWNIGDYIDADIGRAITLAEKLNSLYPEATFAIIDDSLVVNTIESFVVYFPLTGDQDVLLGSLTLILSRLKQDEEEFRIEGDRRVQEIDLRFKNPVLR